MTLLIGMYDSPFVRRVAIALDLLGFPFEHRDWSVGRDFERIRAYSPLGRVPVLVPVDGEPLTESMMILEHLDDLVGPERALLPPPGADRRAALRLLAFATGAAEKAIQIVGERVFRPEHLRHAPNVERCRAQMRGALGELDKACAAAADREWLIGDRLGTADITVACFVTYAHEAVPEPLDDFPALQARRARCEALPVFRRYYAPFFQPDASGGARPSDTEIGAPLPPGEGLG
jgi:glutathione S-transferase